MQKLLHIHNKKLLVVYLQFRCKLGILCWSGTLCPGGIILPTTVTENSLLSVPLFGLCLGKKDMEGSAKKVNQFCAGARPHQLLRADCEHRIPTPCSAMSQ